MILFYMKRKSFNNPQYFLLIGIIFTFFLFHHLLRRKNEKKIFFGNSAGFLFKSLNASSKEKVKETSSLPKVCILVPVCSKFTDWKGIEESFFLTIFLDSMYNTSEFSQYDYSIYLGYDKGDSLFDSENNLNYLFSIVNQRNDDYHCLVNLRNISFDNVLGKPGPIMNFLSETAFREGCDYLYRINDDTEFLTKWTTPFVNTLAGFIPSNVGVVGPTCLQGNTLIMTHDFVHRNHFEIFGFHYPPELTDWWLDDWISSVYGILNTKKLENVEVNHHVMVTRYKPKMENGDVWNILAEKGKNTILGSRFFMLMPRPRIVSYSLYGNDPRYLNGAVENVKLLKDIFKGWGMRIYFDSSVPQSVLLFLQENGVDLIDMTNSNIRNKMSWRFLPAQNNSIERFISRDIDARLSVREFLAVQEWIESNKPFHVMKDHPSHNAYTVSGGLWGSVGGALPELSKWVVEASMGEEYLEDMNFLDRKIWPLMKDAGVLVHDSFSCNLDSSTRRFPSERIDLEHVGSVYLDGKVREGDANILEEAIKNGLPKC